MDFFLNELSIHGQFLGKEDLKAALVRVKNMDIELIKNCNSTLYASQEAIWCCDTTPKEKISQTIGQMERDTRSELLQWLGKMPAMENLEEHQRMLERKIEYETKEGTDVTKRSIGMVAHIESYGHGDACLISLTESAESAWGHSPIQVTKTEKGGDPVDVKNFYQYNELERMLKELGLCDHRPVCSWIELEERAKSQCKRLTFSKDCFKPLKGMAFNAIAAKKIMKNVLGILDDYANCLDKIKYLDDKITDGMGERDKLLEGRQKEKMQKDEIYKIYFTGGHSAWFSDSSDSEKTKYKDALTFSHPEGSGTLFCPWHGKVKSVNFRFRVHFSWPIRAGEPVYVVYVGPKLTKK